MLPTLYGKKSLRTTLSRMASGERLAQSFLFYGDAGLGRKNRCTLVFPPYCSANIPKTDSPADTVKSCHNLQKRLPPRFDISSAQRKTGRFFCRNSTTDLQQRFPFRQTTAAVRSIYFLDCDQMDDRAQNLLLKQLEEPPAYAFFYLQHRQRIRCFLRFAPAFSLSD